VAIAFGTRLGEGSTFGRAALGDDSTRRGYATPSTYSVDGRQYVVVAAGGGKRGPPPATPTWPSPSHTHRSRETRSTVLVVAGSKTYPARAKG
jgi:hypothetical protein